MEGLFIQNIHLFVGHTDDSDALDAAHTAIDTCVGVSEGGAGGLSASSYSRAPYIYVFPSVCVSLSISSRSGSCRRWTDKTHLTVKTTR